MYRQFMQQPFQPTNLGEMYYMDMNMYPYMGYPTQELMYSPMCPMGPMGPQMGQPMGPPLMDFNQMYVMLQEMYEMLKRIYEDEYQSLG
ncbi:MAG: hypothetical protein PWQ67_1130 [Clostridia bacterium]|jgi:hypothetical protein|nr:hypothetical protein [Clostridia bacterium]MDN5322676.1 hypothetical protein [Clostridia bacterium]